MKLSKIECHVVCTALNVMDGEMSLGSKEYGLWVRVATFLNFPEEVIQGLESKRLQARADEVINLI